MKIDKAIEILTLIEAPPSYEFSPDFKDAIKLGNEALTYIVCLRACSLQQRQAHLPGEDD